MDRCALFVDASYMLADGAMAVYGTRNRESVNWDYTGVVQFLGNVARDRTGLPLLRCYWYEATLEGRRTPEHDALADLPGVKLRVGRMRPGRREGVESEIHRDLATLARNRAVSDALVVSAEEDLTQVIADVQDLGMRVTIVHIAVGGNWTISRTLRQECDGILEIGEAHLRPYVELVAGLGAVAGEDRHAVGAYPARSAANGHGPVGPLGHQSALPAGSQPTPPAIYTAPVIAEYQRVAQPLSGWPMPSASNQSGPIAGRVVSQQEQPQHGQAAPTVQMPARQTLGPHAGQQRPGSPQEQSPHAPRPQQPLASPAGSTGGELNGRAGQAQHAGQAPQHAGQAPQHAGQAQHPGQTGPQHSQPIPQQQSHPQMGAQGPAQLGPPAHPAQGPFAQQMPAYPVSAPSAGGAQMAAHQGASLEPGPGQSGGQPAPQPGHAQPGVPPPPRTQPAMHPGPQPGLPQPGHVAVGQTPGGQYGVQPHPGYPPGGHGQPGMPQPGHVAAGQTPGGQHAAHPQPGLAAPGPPSSGGQAGPQPGMHSGPQQAYSQPGPPAAAATGPHATTRPQSPAPAGPATGQPPTGMQSSPAMQPSQPLYPAPPPAHGVARNPSQEGLPGQVPVGVRQGAQGAPPGQMMNGGPPGPPPVSQGMPVGQPAQAPPRPYPGGPAGRYPVGPADQPAGMGGGQGGGPHGSPYVPPQGPYSGPQPATPHAPMPPQPVAL